jgi:hypothetical protein
MDKATLCPHGDWFTTGHAPPPRPDDRPDTAMDIYRDDDRPFYDPHEYKVQIMDGVIQAYIRNHYKGSLRPQAWVRLFDAYQKSGQEEMAIACLAAYAEAEKVAEPLGLSASPYSTADPPSPSRNGQKGMSSKTRRDVVSCVGYLFGTYDRLCLSFITLTLPALSPDDLVKCCQGFSVLVHMVNKRIRERLQDGGATGDYQAVIEIQEERWKKWGQVAPHIHLLCQGRLWRNRPWIITKEWLDNTWANVLANCLGHPVPAKACCRIEVPRKGLRGEMGKYLTKGGQILEEIKDAGKGDLLPHQWQSRYSPMMKRVKEARIHLKGEQATWIDRHLPELRAEGLLTFWWVKRPVVDRVTGEITKQICGAAGRFTSKQAMKTVLERAEQGVKMPVFVVPQDQCA